MSEKIVEAVARAMAQKDAEDEGLKFPTGPMAYRAYMRLARAAIEAYEAATAEPLVRITGTTTWSDFGGDEASPVRFVSTGGPIHSPSSLILPDKDHVE